MVFHDGDVDGIARCKLGRALDDLAGAYRVDLLDGKNFIRHVQDELERGSNSLPFVDRCVTVQDLLQYFSISHKPLAGGYKALQQKLRLRFVRMRISD